MIVVSRYMMKAIAVMLLSVTGLRAVPYFPVTGMTAARREVVRCFADELSRQGYRLDTPVVRRSRGQAGYTAFVKGGPVVRPDRSGYGRR